MNLKEKIEKYISDKGLISLTHSKNRKNDLQKEIIKATIFLQSSKYEITFKDRVFYILQELTDLKKCKCGCEKEVKIMNEYINHHSHKDEKVKKQWLKNKRKTSIKKYGKSNYTNRKKCKQTMKEKYGSDYLFQTESFKDNLKEQMKEKYGVENISQSEEIKLKKADTFFKNYGSTLNDSPIIKDHIRKSRWKNTYNRFKRFSNKIIPLFTEQEFKGAGSKKENSIKYKWKCIKCNTEFLSYYDDGCIPRCPTCFPKYHSFFENSILNHIQTIDKNIKVKQNSRKVIPPLELDLFFPDYNIAIECNGNYWHSELNGTNKQYHLNKTNLCKEKGIHLVHIFEDEWINKEKIVKSRIRNLLKKNQWKIGARKCEIKEITSSLKNKFLEKYHIQGKDNSSVKLGLFYKERLVSVMTFCKRRFDKKDGYELQRFCSISGFTISGGAQKLFKYFLKQYNPLSVISYADKRWSKNGNLYKQLGFIQKKDSLPSYFYIKNRNKRESRIKYQKHKLSNLLKSFNPNKTEWENMQQNDYDRIWDCGNYVFEFINNNNKI